MQLAQPVMHFFHLYLCIFMNSEMSFLDSSVGKESACNVGDLGLIPGLGRYPGEGKGYPLQCYGLENSMDCIVHGVEKSQTRLSDFHFHFPFTFIISYRNKIKEI